MYNLITELGGGDIDGLSEHGIRGLICQPLNMIRTMISIVCQQGLMYTSWFHSPTTSMLVTARSSTKMKTGFQHFLHGQSKVSVSIQTLVETVHTTGWFEMF